MMDRRTNEVPMDFEWQTGKGPVDERSPFHTFALAQQHRQSQQQQQKKSGQSDAGGKKRPYSIFGSPQKAQPPSLREPTSQMHFLFSTTNASATSDPTKSASILNNNNNNNRNKPLPPLTSTTSSSSLFTTPRKLDADVYSSGAENASSPEGAAAGGYDKGGDSEATPEQQQQRQRQQHRQGQRGQEEDTAMKGIKFTGDGLGGFGGKLLSFGISGMEGRVGGANKENVGLGGTDASAGKEEGGKEPSRRGSFFGRFGFLGGAGGSREAELPRGYSTKVEKKVSKRRGARGAAAGGPVIGVEGRYGEKRMVRRRAEKGAAVEQDDDDQNGQNMSSDDDGEDADESSMFVLPSPRKKGGRLFAGNKDSSAVKAAGKRSTNTNNARKTSSKTSNTHSHYKNNNDSNKSPNGNNTGLLSALFTFIERHPSVPHILSFYAQFLLNLFLVFMFISILWSFWQTIRADVDKRADDAIAEAMAELAACAHQYRENRCEPGARVPAMQTVCEGWERCMGRDPRRVGRARVSAHTFAEIFNGFVEPISWKAMIFTLIIVSTSVIVSNAAFAFFRNKALDSLATYSHNYYGGAQSTQPHGFAPQHQPQIQSAWPASHGTPMPSMTPQRQLSGGAGMGHEGHFLEGGDAGVGIGVQSGYRQQQRQQQQGLGVDGGGRRGGWF